MRKLKGLLFDNDGTIVDTHDLILASMQHATRDVYAFVPIQDFSASSSIDWTLPVPDIDKKLCEKYGLTDPERTFIESVIAPMT